MGLQVRDAGRVVNGAVGCDDVRPGRDPDQSATRARPPSIAAPRKSDGLEGFDPVEGATEIVLLDLEIEAGLEVEPEAVGGAEVASQPEGGVGGDAPLAVDDKADASNGDRERYDPALAIDRDIMVYRISGAFFFGAVAAVSSVLDRLSGYKALVIDFKAVPLLDSTAANAIAQIAAKARRQGIRVFITGASPSVRRTLLSYGTRPPQAKYRSDIASAVSEIKRLDQVIDSAGRRVI